MEDCADICHGNSDCKYWQHDKSTQTCTLKEVYEGAEYVGGEDIVSGISPCPRAEDDCKYRFLNAHMISLKDVLSVNFI